MGVPETITDDALPWYPTGSLNLQRTMIKLSFKFAFASHHLHQCSLCINMTRIHNIRQIDARGKVRIYFK